MPRNLVICCDGTNNSLEGPPTNVLHLRNIADIGDPTRQLVKYDPGVGVEADPRMRTGIGATWSRWSGSAFGTGLVENVEQAYSALIKEYKEQDRIYLFGFSRGAYTVRVLAGLLFNYGLLKESNLAEVPRVVKHFQKLILPNGKGFVGGIPITEQKKRLDEAAAIKRNLSVPCPVHFMGVFDTVSSLGWAWDPKSFPNTRKMPEVKILRHAMALDERRAKFRTNRIELTENADHRQVWFAGVHSDVGGGYEDDNKLSRIPLRWMLAEAVKAGMLVDAAQIQKLNLDATWQEDEQAAQHESLTAAWHALEYLPLPHWEKNSQGVWKEGRRVYRGAGWREIPDTFEAHESLQRRKRQPNNPFWPGAGPSMNYRN